MFAAYVIIFLASLLGNSVIIHIIRADNSLKTTTNRLIMTQAYADLLMTFIELPFSIYHRITNSLWFGGVFGFITCKMTLAAVFSVPQFSVLMLVMIAVDRFYAVLLPLRQSPISKHLKKIIAILLLWSSAWSLSFINAKNFIKAKKSHYCDLSLLFNNWNEFNITSLVSCIVVPLLIIVNLYAAVCWKLWSRKVPGEGEHQIKAQRIAKRVTLMMIVVVVLYILFWFPSFVIGVLHFFKYAKLRGKLLLLFMWLPTSYSGLNPYVYLIFCQNFRKSLKKLFGNFLRPLYSISHRSRSVELQQI